MKCRNYNDLLSGFCLKTDGIKRPRQVILIPEEMGCMLIKRSELLIGNLSLTFFKVTMPSLGQW